MTLVNELDEANGGLDESNGGLDKANAGLHGGWLGWHGMRVGDDGSGLRGLIATRDLPAGYLVPYNGRVLGKNEFGHTYTLGQTDANPEKKECAPNRCIAGFVNEAPPGKRYNCHFFNFQRLKHPPWCKKHYFGDKKQSEYMVVMVDVKAGEQLFCWYGEDGGDKSGDGAGGYNLVRKGTYDPDVWYNEADYDVSTPSDDPVVQQFNANVTVCRRFERKNGFFDAPTLPTTELDVMLTKSDCDALAPWLASKAVKSPSELVHFLFQNQTQAAVRAIYQQLPSAEAVTRLLLSARAHAPRGFAGDAVALQQICVVPANRHICCLSLFRSLALYMEDMHRMTGASPPRQLLDSPAARTLALSGMPIEDSDELQVLRASLTKLANPELRVRFYLRVAGDAGLAASIGTPQALMAALEML